MVMPCRGCLYPQLYFIIALYTAFSRGGWPRLKAFFLVVFVAKNLIGLEKFEAGSSCPRGSRRDEP